MVHSVKGLDPCVAALSLMLLGQSGGVTMQDTEQVSPLALHSAPSARPQLDGYARIWYNLGFAAQVQVHHTLPWVLCTIHC